MDTNAGDVGDAGVYARESPRLGRAVELGAAAGRTLSVSFPAAVPDDAAADHPVLDRLFDYLDGAEDDFADVTLGLTVPTVQRSVLESTRNVPYGESVTLDRVVAMTAELDPDDGGDVDAARTALANNPTPILVPDHRVRDAPGATPGDVSETLRDVEGVETYS
ncbi:MGMT family protein [Candidatus Halobonum tyrrellensis]|uniref:Methylated-DNA--protein-cysteine methyltransferase n=1 Tax=Candidatus Halobonum tyrrellensis G22 TaxID=1324957 RepID=V4HE37_9EURY|nr:MGMT family protein [Candidatus Halobonum tyrrellensis]ESP88303.1 methylated-DNA--protein-cysteine methyltransferase [Candidatus Halobonum tyrrellensis G22]